MPVKRLKLQSMTYYLFLNATDNVSVVFVQPAGHPGILGRFLQKERSWRNTAVVTGEKSLIKISVLFCFSCTSKWKSHTFKADQSIQSQTTIIAISKTHVLVNLDTKIILYYTSLLVESIRYVQRHHSLWMRGVWILCQKSFLDIKKLFPWIWKPCNGTTVSILLQVTVSI